MIDKPFPWHKLVYAGLVRRDAVVPHALLLRGARGIGKLAFARAVSKALLCESREPTGGACEACTACLWFQQGAHPDFLQIEPLVEKEAESGGEEQGGTITVDQIRALPDFINISSHRGGFRAIVIQPAEALNVNAANALLKSLEEPPPRTCFLLVTHRPHRLLPTIRSRCRQLALAPPQTREAAAWLEKEGVRDGALALAHFGGAPLLAAELSGSNYWGGRAAFLRQLTSPELDVLAAAEAVRDCPAPDAIGWLQKWSYDIAHFRVLGRVRYNPDHETAISRIAARVTPLATLRFHREMTRTQRIAQHPLNPRLFLEQLLFDYRDLLRSAAAAA